MRVLKFRLSGETAFFKKPDVNTYFYFTYGHLHKIALLGLFGAILGYGGYAQQKKDEMFPAFYERLKNLQLSVVPIGAVGGVFPKKIQVFNNSVGYASQEQGGNLVVREQWLENPAWDIYVQVACEESEKLAYYLNIRKSIFIPYLGKNDHLASISDVEIFSDVIRYEQPERLDSLFLKQDFAIHFPDYDDYDEDEEDMNPYKYEEKLPVALNAQTNLYEVKTFVLTNMKVSERKKVAYSVGGRILTFY
ncbi:MAG TPA: type I-B CRISPR-associated protein Cas5b [Firmicutes bacterium]|nr:type I-B CRISPR-associated protein Cas5b [Bacillota bacterium]